ncbi:MAG: hypothetical protein ACFHX7_12280 [Pseudomonadota bacterium]
MSNSSLGIMADVRSNRWNPSLICGASGIAQSSRVVYELAHQAALAPILFPYTPVSNQAGAFLELVQRSSPGAQLALIARPARCLIDMA